MKVNAAECLMLGLIATVLMFSSQCVASTPCDPNPCKNEGTCTVSSGSADCTCAPGWDGNTCEDVSCTNNPCLHGGTCADSTGSIDCTCDTGYGGDRCELAPKCIDSTACENGGTCKADTNTGQHICFCAPGFGGDLCADVSCINNPCLNEGTCEVENGAIDCTCAPGWGGERCADVSCTNNPCLHGGTCAVSTGSIVCTCVTGNGGDRCELAPKCTDTTACENGGTCQADTTGQHICFCAPGFGGDLCADASGAARISGHFILLTVVAVLEKLNLN